MNYLYLKISSHDIIHNKCTNNRFEIKENVPLAHGLNWQSKMHLLQVDGNLNSAKYI